MSSAKWRPFCLDLNVLNIPVSVTLAHINIQGNRDEYDLLLTLLFAKSQREWYIYIYIYIVCAFCIRVFKEHDCKLQHT